MDIDRFDTNRTTDCRIFRSNFAFASTGNKSLCFKKSFKVKLKITKFSAF